MPALYESPKHQPIEDSKAETKHAYTEEKLYASVCAIGCCDYDVLHRPRGLIHFVNREEDICDADAIKYLDIFQSYNVGHCFFPRFQHLLDRIIHNLGYSGL